MFIKNASTKKILRAIISGILPVILWATFAVGAESRDSPEFDKPFKVCRIYPNTGGAVQTAASDNEQNLIYTNENNFLSSVNPESSIENWRSQTGGKISPTIISDNESIYFLSSFVDESQETIYTLNSISQKTGIANWQKKLAGYREIRLSESVEQNTIYLTAENRSILAVAKTDGTQKWTKNLRSKIISITALPNNRLSVLTEESLIKLSNSGGELISENKIRKNPSGNSIGSDAYLLLGYANGEFLKISSAGNAENVLWKIKAGGNISSVIEIENEVLISSFDNFLYLYSISSGKLRWKRRVSGRINIKPLIVKNYAIVLSSTDSIASIVDLDGGKIVNQIKIEDGNYFSDDPIVLGKFIIFPTFRGIYLFVNSDYDCK